MKTKKVNIKRICLWSGPRNISTTLMYAFAQRSDTKVYDEPLYAYYLNNSNAKTYHPGAEEILEGMNNDGTAIVEKMTSNAEAPALFCKHMTKHLLDLKLDFMHDMVNVILTRDPKEMLPSFSKVISNPTLEDVGYKKHVELLHYFENNQIDYIVLDSRKVLMDPEKVLRSLCDKIGISFQNSMLSWERGARPEDGVWAKYWYANIHNSTGFKTYQPKKEKFPKNLEPLLLECKPYYEKLLALAIG